MKNQNSRSNRFEKKRKSTKLITLVLSVASVLVISVIAMLIFGGNGENTTAKEAGAQKEIKLKEDENTSSDDESSGTSESTEEAESTSDEDKETVTDEKEQEEKKEEESSEEELTVEEKSDDENVKRIIKKDWEPVETKQELEGDHRVVYDKGSQDWAEMLQAIRQVTGLTESNMITNYIGNGGSPNKAVATVYNRNNQNEIYRVYIEWLDGTGYQVQKMEELNQLPD
ncbi:YrrS family protein [Halobacillus salinus]|uniref:YrrS family protein n=1 Tax=Halobacillus salinus TaxID=192814 RepID=UPI0015923B09|nr:YrrS family protein [Halobacillus salinus]